jgi:hypothetical protein
VKVCPPKLKESVDFVKQHSFTEDQNEHGDDRIGKDQPGMVDLHVERIGEKKKSQEEHTAEDLTDLIHIHQAQLFLVEPHSFEDEDASDDGHDPQIHVDIRSGIDPFVDQGVDGVPHHKRGGNG